MRKLTTITGLMIIIFLVTAMAHVTTDFAKYSIAFGTILVAICLIIIKIPRPGNKKKRKGILKG